MQGAFDSFAMGNYPYPSSYMGGALPAWPMRAACELLASPRLSSTQLLTACSQHPPGPGFHMCISVSLCILHIYPSIYVSCTCMHTCLHAIPPPGRLPVRCSGDVPFMVASLLRRPHNSPDMSVCASGNPRSSALLCAAQMLSCSSLGRPHRSISCRSGPCRALLLPA